MLGYQEDDVEEMKDAILKVMPVDDPSTSQTLMNAFDLLDGLIVEGHIQGDNQ